MSTPEALLKHFLVDCDNSKIEDKPSNIIWENLITSTEQWTTLIALSFTENQCKSYFDSLDTIQRHRYFSFAVACSINFVQSNFTGPELPPYIQEYLNSDLFCEFNFSKYLSLNNEDINVSTKFPALLVVSHCIFKNCEFSPILNTWWLWRSTIIYQQVLDELSPSLLSLADNLQKEIECFTLQGHLKAKFEIEQAQLYLIYRNVSKAKSHLEIAADILGLNYQLMGKLGKRTKFQQEDIAQLMLEVQFTDKENIERPPVLEFDVPKNVKLEDDVRLDAVEYLESTSHATIPNTEQKLLLAKVQLRLMWEPPDDLYFEEIQPFLDLILSQNNTWTVRVVTLLLRCKVEAKHKRTVERALMQCEEVSHSIKKAEPHPLNRVGSVYGCGLQPIWKIEGQLADLMLNLGMVKASLDIYLRLQLWEDVIVCYTILNMRHKAAEIIRQQLHSNPTVKLWCLLGDATDDVTCYEKAWELSKKHSSRVQRHWGQFLFSRKQYSECIPHFEKSVSINPLQSNVWLCLGFAALETEKWQVAATAYRRYTTLEPGGFEAWNNLAKAYIKLGNKRSAHQALTDALRCNFENWKIWDNLLVVSADIGHFSDVIRAYHRLLDLKEKHLDLEVLEILVYAVRNNVNDCEGRPSGRLMQKTRELLGRVTVLYPVEGHLWELYACLAPALLLKAQRLHRAYRGYIQGNWEKDPARCRQVLCVCQKLAQIALDDEIQSTDSLINSVRLTVNTTVIVAKRHDWEETRDLLQEVAALLHKVLEKAKVPSEHTVTT